MVVIVHGAGSLAQPLPGAGDSGPGSDKAAATPAMVAQTASACFSATVRGTGYMVPRAEAVVIVPLEGLEIAEVLAGEGDVVTERQPLARLVRASAEAASPAQAVRPGPAAPTAPSARASRPSAAPPATSPAPATEAAGIVLRAPAAGRIVDAAATQGAMTSPRGAPLFRIAIDGTIEADAEVSSLYLKEIKENQTARVEIDHGYEIAGRVRKVASEIDPATQMGHVRISIDGESPWRVGRFVRATIDARQSCGISVPRSAVAYTSDGTSVQVVRANLIETIPVRVGLTSDRDAEIQTGLRAGELVVAHAGTSLRDGDRVNPVFIDEAAAPSTGQH